jgi:hypothetical protein
MTVPAKPECDLLPNAYIFGSAQAEAFKSASAAMKL